jgi:gamma-carbonic anhydrase
VSNTELAWIKESAENYVKYTGQYLGDSSRPKPGFKV